MSKAMPSLLALLGLVAVAGYQNRDKIGQVIGDLQNGAGRSGGKPDGLGGMLSGLGSMLGGTGGGGKVLTGGLLQRLATAIPETVDKLTPGGAMPTEDEARARLFPAA